MSDLTGLQGDVAFAWRLIWKHPGLTLTTVLCLAVGIGATTSLFTLVHAIFLHPLPFHEPDRLVAVYGTDQTTAGATGLSHLPISLPNYGDLVGQNASFSGLTAYAWTAVSFVGQGEPERIVGQIVTPNFFEVLGVRPHLGRFFTEEDEHSPVAVLSHQAWRTHFGGDRGVVGRAVLLNTQSFTVVGVASEGFRGTSTVGAPQLWVPMGVHPIVYPHSANLELRQWRLLSVVGRLAPGVSIGRARTEAALLARRLLQEFPRDNEGRGLTLISLVEAVVHPDQMDQVARAGALPLVVAFLVLLVACISVACLLLARATTRHHEIAVRMSFGATRGQVIRQLLVESVALALVGGALGCLLASWSRGFLWNFLPPLLTSEAVDLRLSGGVLVFTLGVSVLTGILFGLAPALQLSRPRISQLLKSREGVRQGGIAFRDLLVGSQIALATMSLVAAGLFLRSLHNAQEVDLGFEAENLVTLSFDLGAQRYDPEHRLQFHEELVEAARSMPGVSSAAVAEKPPLDTSPGLLRRVVAEGRATDPTGEGVLVRANSISPGYLQLLGTPLLRGRVFTEADREGSRRVAIVNAAVASSLWPGGDPVGRRLSFVGDPGEIEVVGVAGNARYDDVTEEHRPYVFLPLAQRNPQTVALAVRVARSLDEVIAPLRQSVRDLDPTLPIVEAGPVSDRVSKSLWAPRIAASLLGLFGVLALAITAIGLYGVVAHSVSQRTREIGIRISVGALRREVLWMILRKSLILAGIGIAVGVGAALAGHQLLQSLLYGVEPSDLGVLSGAALILTFVVALAALIPARRASLINPVAALRLE